MLTWKIINFQKTLSKLFDSLRHTYMVTEASVLQSASQCQPLQAFIMQHYGFRFDTHIVTERRAPEIVRPFCTAALPAPSLSGLSLLIAPPLLFTPPLLLL